MNAVSLNLMPAEPAQGGTPRDENGLAAGDAFARVFQHTLSATATASGRRGSDRSEETTAAEEPAHDPAPSSRASNKKTAASPALLGQPVTEDPATSPVTPEDAGPSDVDDPQTAGEANDHVTGLLLLQNLMAAGINATPTPNGPSQTGAAPIGITGNGASADLTVSGVKLDAPSGVQQRSVSIQPFAGQQALPADGLAANAMAAGSGTSASGDIRPMAGRTKAASTDSGVAVTDLDQIVAPATRGAATLNQTLAAAAIAPTPETAQVDPGTMAGVAQGGGATAAGEGTAIVLPPAKSKVALVPSQMEQATEVVSDAQSPGTETEGGDRFAARGRRAALTSLANRVSSRQDDHVAGTVSKAGEGETEAQPGEAATAISGPGPSAEKPAVPTMVWAAENGAVGIQTGQTGVVDQVLRHVRLITAPGHTSLQIRLEPESLGRLDLRMVTDSAGLIVSLSAETNEVKKVIEANLPLLKAAFAEQGIQVDRLVVDLRQQAFAGFDTAANRQRPDYGTPMPRYYARAPGTDQETEYAETAVPRPWTVRPGRIDLWV